MLLENCKECDALLSGSLGSAEQVDQIIYALEKIKARNLNCTFTCAILLCHNAEKSCVVADGVRGTLN